MKINAYKIKLAQRFLNELKKNIKKIQTTVNAVSLEMYSNGREQGYHLHVLTGGGAFSNLRRWGCSFSENRNSDQLVIYIGESFTSFSMQGNAPVDSIYKNARYFRPRAEDIREAVKYVTDDLTRFLKASNAALHGGPHAKV